MADLYYDRGTYYLTIGWTLSVIALLVVAVRLYSRLVLTRSAGSDDFAITISTCLSTAGEIMTTLAVTHGLGRHEELLDNRQVSQITKWEFVDWINVFVSYFFVRASVMLFVLRLLPPNRKWQERAIFVAFFFNFAITLIATVSFSLRCRPFAAIYKSVPHATCVSERVLVITMQVNAILACLIDIVTAAIPAILLWKVQMKAQTKVILNVVFALGLITSGLSIGRAAATNGGLFKMDNTWRSMPTEMFSMVEEKCGIIFASGPAIRQFVAHVRRVGTAAPTKRRQRPGADFVKMRYRITLRDLFWYRRTPRGARVSEPRARLFSCGDREALPGPLELGAEKSRLDVEEAKAKRVFSVSIPRMVLMSLSWLSVRVRRKTFSRQELGSLSVQSPRSPSSAEGGEA